MSPTPTGPDTLGRRIRRLREEQERSQAELGAPQLSRAYVDAVERDRLWPCPEALALFAERLETGIDQLRVAAQPPVAHPDPIAVDEDIAFQLACAENALHTDPQRVLARIGRIERTYGHCLPALQPRTRFWLHRLRGMAHLRNEDPGLARAELDAALALAPCLPGHAPEIVRVHNARGALYYLQDQPDQALKEHEQCMRLLRTGAIKDKNLWVIVFNNVANDYWALNDVKQALGIYRETLNLLEDVVHPDRQAETYLGLSLVHEARGELLQAELFARRALDVHAAAGNRERLAVARSNLAQILISQDQYAEAESLLYAARAVFAESGQDLALATVFQLLATLELKRRRIDAAAAAVRHSLALCAEVQAREAAGADQASKANTTRTYARVLSTAGRIAEHQGDRPAADECFRRALVAVAQTTYNETAAEIEYAYAELLSARGTYEPANRHYRAALARAPQRHLN